MRYIHERVEFCGMQDLPTPPTREEYDTLRKDKCVVLPMHLLTHQADFQGPRKKQYRIHSKVVASHFGYTIKDSHQRIVRQISWEELNKDTYEEWLIAMLDILNTPSIHNVQEYGAEILECLQNA